MDKDLYIEFLESEIRRIRAGANTHYGQSIGWLDEIQDLKLENDRLKRRNELMEDYIHAVACITSKKSKFKGLCDDVQCPYYDYDKGFGQGACTLGSREWIEQEAADIIEKLEEL